MQAYLNISLCASAPPVNLLPSTSESLYLLCSNSLCFLFERPFVLVVFQNATQNSLELVDDPKAAAVDEIAAKLGLCKVGRLFLLALSLVHRVSQFAFDKVVSYFAFTPNT